MTPTDTFIITALQSWGSDSQSNAERMAQEISRTYRVLYVNPPLDILSLLSGDEQLHVLHKNRVLRGSEHALSRVNDNLWVFEPPIVLTLPAKLYSDMVFDIMNRHNNRRYAQAILWAIRHFDIGRFYLIIDNDIFRSFYLDEILSPVLSIYYRRDNPFSIGYWRRHGRRLEPELARRSDMVIASSDPLAEQVRPYNYNTYNIGRGVDVSAFDRDRHYTTVAAMRGIRHPIIGFAGTLGVLYTSANLLMGVAKCYPDCSIVLVGGQDAVFMRHGLHEMANVYFIDALTGDDLAACISEFDVCLSPQVHSDLTMANYPDNIVHYLSLGKNVVCMATDPMAMFLNEVQVVDNVPNFLLSVGIALDNPPGEAMMNRREQLARSLSWESCVDRLYALVDMVSAESQEAEEFLSKEEVYS